MKKVFLFLSFVTLFSAPSSAQQKMSTSEYIAVYSDLAIASMIEYSIPASIKMGQAIIESSSGNSRLALSGNNHFGIKCKTEWEGEKIYHDDDAVGECFRKYSSPYDSYIDHNEFLTTRDRYSSLFDLDITDYKAWANGLKAAGYATSPTYATDLIRVIEDNKLYLLDDKALEGDKEEEVVEPKQEIVVQKPKEEPVQSNQSIYSGVYANSIDYIEVDSKSGIPTYINNNVKFVIARRGDTFDSLSKITGKSVSKLLKYNELDFKPDAIKEGSIIYIAAKKSKASNGYNYHTVAKNQSLHYVSQKYGIKIEKLAKLNLYSSHYVIKVGQKILLR
ncbi:MAG: glucosaminidase domain-containing protein [Rikenellaceae bacterium]